MIEVDGSMGEGGGQLLRSALSLSLLTGTPFCMRGIRAGRKKPGLMRQHLTCVLAAAAVGDAEVRGASLGSGELSFRPHGLRAGEHHFAVGTAGSTMLLLQTVLVPLLRAGQASRLVLEGGTHNPTSPPFEFIAGVFVPVLRRMGARVQLRLERHGFYPAGGGRVLVELEPCAALSPLELLERGAITAQSATALVCNLPHHVGQRELHALQKELGWERSSMRLQPVTDAQGPGNALLAEIRCEHVSELIVGFGEKRVSAELIAAQVARDVRRFLSVQVPVGEHLADQLLLPLATGAGGTFRTLALSLHATTQIALIRMFVGAQISVEREAEDVCRVSVLPPRG